MALTHVQVDEEMVKKRQVQTFNTVSINQIQNSVHVNIGLDFV